MALAGRDEVFLVCIATVHTQTENSALKKTGRKVERTDLACLRPPPARCRMKKEPEMRRVEKVAQGKKGTQRAGKLTNTLKSASTAQSVLPLQRTLSSVSSTYISNSRPLNSRGPSALLWTLWAPIHVCTYPHMDTLTYT